MTFSKFRLATNTTMLFTVTTVTILTAALPRWTFTITLTTSTFSVIGTLTKLGLSSLGNGAMVSGLTTTFTRWILTIFTTTFTVGRGWKKRFIGGRNFFGGGSSFLSSFFSSFGSGCRTSRITLTKFGLTSLGNEAMVSGSQ